jgi:hypothetical protein
VKRRDINGFLLRFLPGFQDEGSVICCVKSVI